jgi:glycosyltransferase involved in cell wall biosynthesis
MKIFFATSSSKIDLILQNLYASNQLDKVASFNDIVLTLNSCGFASLFGLPKKNMFNSKCDFQIFTNVYDSELIQKKWANEENISYGNDWKIDILKKQIEIYEPDVIYTNNPGWISKNIDKLPHANLMVAWRAAPIGNKEDYSCFNLGLSYAPVYRDLMKRHGIHNLEHMDFSFNPEIKKYIDYKNLEKKNDICFVGRYGKMFKKRNMLLNKIHRQFKDTNTIAYHLLTEKRFGGVVPHLPWRMLNSLKKPIFLNELLETFATSKIIINTHSDISAQYKGNMRVFESLGTGSFMLSDKGIYPKFLRDGKDFVSYDDTDDLLNKIEYYLENDDEREKIAKHGYETICKHYSTEIGSKKLKSIFEDHL